MDAVTQGTFALGTPRKSRASIVVSIAFVVSAISCESVATNAGSVDRIVLTPNTATLQVGASQTLTAIVLDAAGSAMRDRRVVWASERESIATVSQSGVVIALAPGEARIAASSGGKSASAVITVTARPVSLVRVTPGSATISVGGSILLQAEALDASGAVVVGHPAVWTSSNETIAVVSTNGIVAGLSPGSVTVTATIDGRSGTAAINVAPQPVASVTITPTADTAIVGERVTFRATALDAQDKPLPDRFVLWTSSNSAIATVSSEGEVIALAVGSARIRAIVEGKFAEATILVQPVPVARVFVAPNEVTLNPGQTSQLTVTLSDSAGNVLTGRSVVYSTSDARIATVSATGLIIAIAEGAAAILVSSEEKSATVAVTVNPVPVAAVTITPNAVSLSPSQSSRLVAQALDAQGKPLANRTYAWSTEDAIIATVNQSGDVTAVSSGSVEIRATTGGQTGRATVTVSNAVAQIVISPKPVGLIAPQTQQLSVQFFDSRGGLLSPAGRSVSWLSRDPSIASVSNTGQVGAVAVGVTQVLASTPGGSGVLVDSVSVTVSSTLVLSVSVQPKPHTIYVGASSALRAVVVNAGTVVRNSAVSWQSRAASIVTVTPAAGFPDSAIVAGITLGSAYVVATDPGGVSDSSLVTVTAVPVASVSVSPATASLAVNATAQLTALAKDSAGGALTTPITWVSLAPTVASVSATGLVTAASGGSATIEARANGAGVNGVDVVGTAAVSVTVATQVPVNKVTATSGRGYIVPGDTMHLTVVLQDSQKNVLTGRIITFSSSNTSKATVDASGVVTGVGTTGRVDIVVTSEGKTDTIQLTADPSVGTIYVTGPLNGPLDLLLLRGQKKKYTVTVVDGSGRRINGQVITVTNSDPNVMTVSNTTITTGSSGTATIDITANNLPGFATITFTAIRSGAIPPASAGSNDAAASITIVVP